jgi:hypothetical protein
MSATAPRAASTGNSSETDAAIVLYEPRLTMVHARRQSGWVAAALLALVMLSYASVQSIVMQAAAASPARLGALCSSGGRHAMAMPGMDPTAYGSPSSGQGFGRSADHHGGCPYCAAAANPPMAADCTPIRVPAAVAFVAFQNVASHGPRGPPAATPRARGPPPTLTPA